MATTSAAIDVGVFVLAPQFPGQSQAAALHRARAVAIAAEHAGLTHAWFAEHHFVSYGMCPSATTFASFVLGATRRITVGTAISVLSSQHPVALGERTALLDHLSGGRFVLAAARGLPVLLGMHIDDDAKRRLVTRWADVASAHGHDPTDPGHVSAGIAHVADTRDEAVRTLRTRMPPLFARGLGDHVTVDGRPRPVRDHLAYTEFLCSAHPVGTVDDCAARLAQSAQQTGIRRYALLVEAAGDHAAALETTAALGREVAPRLTRDTARDVRST